MMLCVPAGSVDVVNLAVREVMVTVPRVVVPSLRVTVPAGVPPNCGVTVAVNVTDCPVFEGFSDETSLVVVLAFLTPWLSVFEVLARNEVLPLYTAVIEFVPTANFVVVNLATPALSVHVASVAVPFMKATAPVGVPLNSGATVAVKVTD